MKQTGLPARGTTAMASFLTQLVPAGIAGRFAAAGALLVAAIVILSIRQGLQWQWIIGAWTLGLAGAVLLIALYRSIQVRFDKLSASLESIGLGELSGRVDTILTGESGRVVDSVREMNQGLVDIVQHVRGSCDKIHVAAREIAAGSGDLSQRTEEQASTLEQIASSMEELATTVKQNSDHCQMASRLTAESSQLAGQSAQCVRRAVDSMSLVDEGSRKIAEISKLIEGIALQTNILALNAAVEAARAGEHGRGFSVVAGEVRALAQRCSEAALDIKRLIETSVGNIDTSVAIVNDAGRAIDQVAASVAQAAELIGEIASASRDQSAGVDQVSQSIMQLEHANLQNAALVEQTTAAARLFEDEVDKLHDVVGHFKLDRAQGRHTAVELVHRAAEHLRAVGKRQAFDDFDDPTEDFIFGEYYIWAMDLNGIRLANGSDPSSRGENILEIRDIDGKPHVRQIIDKARSKGKGWEDYKWLHPVTRRIEQKSVYFELVDGAIVACGIYKGDAAAQSAAASNKNNNKPMAGTLLPGQHSRPAPKSRTLQRKSV